MDSILDADQSAVAGEGQTSYVGSESFFYTGIPNAISTVTRENRQRGALTDASQGGSFLDSSSQSNGNQVQPYSRPLLQQSTSRDRPLCDAEPSKSAIEDPKSSKSDDRLSTDSSLGIIEVDMMSDLSSSVLNLDSSPEKRLSTQHKKLHGNQSTSTNHGNNETSSSRSRSLSQDRSSKSGSSESHPFLQPNVNTIKRCPVPVTAPEFVQRSDGVRQSLVFKGTNFGEDNEGDVTVPEVHLMEDEVNQLDADFGDLWFSDNDDDGEDQKEEKDEGMEGTCLRKTGNGSNNRLSITMRQSAEGDVVTSPVPGDGGGGGDGSSGSDSESQTGHLASQAQEFLEQFRPSFPVQPTRRVDMEEQRVRPVGDDLLTEKGANRYSTYQAEGTPTKVKSTLLDSRYFKPSTYVDTSTTQESQRVMAQDESSFSPEDMLNDLESTRSRDHQQTVNTEAEGTPTKVKSTLLDSRYFKPSTYVDTSNPRESQQGLAQDESSFFPEDMLKDFEMRSKDQQAVNTEVDGTPTKVKSPLLDSRYFKPSTYVDNSTTQESQRGMAQDESSFFPEDMLKDFETRSKDQQAVNTEPSAVTEPDNLFGVAESSFGSFGASPPPADPCSNKMINGACTLDNIVCTEKQQQSCDVGEKGTHLTYSTAVPGDHSQQDIIAAEFADEDFFSSGKEMLDEDEEIFEKEHVFREDDVIPKDQTATETSWVFRSQMSVTCQSSVDTGEDVDRISIGTFLKSKSGALGSLGGEEEIPRPEFGMKIKTPEHQKPVPLLLSESSSELKNDSRLTDDTSNKSDNTPTNMSAELTLAEHSDILSLSDIHRFISSVSSTKTPAELAKMVIGMSSKKNTSAKADHDTPASKGPATSNATDIAQPKRSETEGGNRTQSPKSTVSRLPVRKGSSLVVKREKSSSSSFRNVKQSQGEMRVEELTPLISSGESKPDGEESGIDVKSTASMSIPNSLGSSKESVRMATREIPSGVHADKSLVSSTNSLGLTGHHIPDGTEYSFNSEVIHHGNGDLGSRDDLVGTSDIQMADSRGFDVINTQTVKDVHSKFKSQAEMESKSDKIAFRRSDERSQLLTVTRPEETHNRTECHTYVHGLSNYPLTDSFFCGEESKKYHGNVDQRTNKENAVMDYENQTFSMPVDGHCFPKYYSTPAVREDNSTQFVSFDQSDVTAVPQLLDKSNLSAYPQQEEVGKSSGSSVLTPVEAPKVLTFSDVCVGVSVTAALPLTNYSRLWVECHLHITEVTLNGQPLSSETVPFQLRPKVVIEGLTKEELSVIFIPKLPGVYLARLSIASRLFLRDKMNSSEIVYSEICLKATAEKPRIKIMTNKHGCIDFGHMNWGSCREMSMSIINEGKAMVPLRLAISSISWHCFTFEPMNSPGDISVVSRSSRPQTNALGKIVITTCLPGNHIEPQEIKIYCRPPYKHCEAKSMLPPDKMSGKIDIEVDTPSSYLPPLATVKLGAVVGIQKLHIDKHLQAIQMKTVFGCKVESKVWLKNVGNLNLDILLSILDYKMSLFVHPHRVCILPGNDVQVTVGFQALDKSQQEYQTVMLIELLPDGDVYEVPIRVTMVKESSEVQPTLLGDKRYLSYGGVDLGKVKQQKVTVLSKSSQMTKIRIEIRSETGDFQLQSNFNSQATENVPSRVRDVFIQPSEKYPIYVLYAPSDVAASTGKLVIKPFDATYRYTIPLDGYGGVSSLRLDGAIPISAECYRLEMGPMVPGQRCTSTVTLRNVGSRPCYIYAICCKDSRCKQQIKDGHISVRPNGFVLPHWSSKKVVVIVTPSERDCALQDNSLAVGGVAFIYGDEISRQRFRRACAESQKKGKEVKPPDDELLRNIDFRRTLLNEEVAGEETPGPKVLEPQTDLFYSTMSCVTVSLMGQSTEKAMGTRSVHTGVQHLHSKHASTVNILPEYRAWRSVPQSESLPSLEGQTMQDAMGPSKLIPTVQGGARPKATQHLNSSCVPVQGSSTRPDKRIPQAVPQSESVPGPDSYEPNKEQWMLSPSTIKLTAPQKNSELAEISKFQVVNFLNRQLTFELCWPGHLIKVTPEKGTVEPRSYTCICISARTVENFDSLPWKGSVQVSCDNQCQMLRLQVRKDEAVDKSLPPKMSLASELGATKKRLAVGDNSRSTSAVKLSKVTFPTANIDNTVGEISDTKENKQWIVSSCAPTVVELTGRLSANAVPQHWHPTTHEEQNVEQPTHQAVRLRDNATSIQFQCCVNGEQTIKVPVKNTADISKAVKVIPPKPPFHVRCTGFDIRMRNFVKFPVKFNPKKTGKYEELLTIEVEDGSIIHVKLRGECTK